MALTNAHENIAVEESLFFRVNGNSQLCVIGLINTRTNEFRTEAVNPRDSQIIEKIIRSHIPLEIILLQTVGVHTTG